MPLVACNCHCRFAYNGHCELTWHLDQDYPVICPQRRSKITGSILPGPVMPGWEELPGSFSTAKHYRYPGISELKPSTRRR